jgi:hypothetical protein
VVQQVWAALCGGWVFNGLYGPIAGLPIWRWPGLAPWAVLRLGSMASLHPLRSKIGVHRRRPET